MTAGLIGTKVGMTRVFTDEGHLETVTVVKAGPCVVLQVKTPERDGYHAVQLGFQDAKPHRSTKPMIGHAAKAKTGPKREVREIRLAEASPLAEGDVVSVEQFTEQEVKWVDVVGITKGKGYAGVMKRYGFGGQPASHGTERKHRSPGSIGGGGNLGTARGIKKGKKMAGHMGHVRRTASNLRLMGVDAEHGLLVIRGSIPGPNGATVVVKQAKKKG
jgi:large subunit ribosomal protein L3